MRSPVQGAAAGVGGMRRVQWIAYWVVAGLLSSGTGAVLADSPTSTATDVPVVVVRAEGGATDLPDCSGMSPDVARAQAQEASRRGAHRRAAECYVQAGDHAQANRSYVKAAEHNSAESSLRMAATADDAKLQARRLREAFRRR